MFTTLTSLTSSDSREVIFPRHPRRFPCNSTKKLIRCFCPMTILLLLSLLKSAFRVSGQFSGFLLQNWFLLRTDWKNTHHDLHICHHNNLFQTLKLIFSTTIRLPQTNDSHTCMTTFHNRIDPTKRPTELLWNARMQAQEKWWQKRKKSSRVWKGCTNFLSPCSPSTYTDRGLMCFEHRGSQGCPKAQIDSNCLKEMKSWHCSEKRTPYNTSFPEWNLLLPKFDLTFAISRKMHCKKAIKKMQRKMQRPASMRFGVFFAKRFINATNNAFC